MATSGPARKTESATPLVACSGPTNCEVYKAELATYESPSTRHYETSRWSIFSSSA